MKKQYMKEIICQAKQGKKTIMEKLNRAPKMLKFGASKSRVKEGGPLDPATAAYLNLSGFHTTMGLSTPDMLQLTLAPHLASLTTMGISC